MQLHFHMEVAKNYTSSSQKARVLTEDWVNRYIYCPNCGLKNIEKYDNNKPVADFFCNQCEEDYELKSKSGAMINKIVDGAHKTMIERLNSDANPNFFFLNYALDTFSVRNFFVIPKHFFVPEIIEKRKPLKKTARRAGWVGCNILLQNIPLSGKIYYIRNGAVESTGTVLQQWQKTLFLKREKNKGWLIDIINCIEHLNKNTFSLDEIYSFEATLATKHPENRHIKDKIRQQLQILRDRGYLEFKGNGNYRLTNI